MRVSPKVTHGCEARGPPLWFLCFGKSFFGPPAAPPGVMSLSGQEDVLTGTHSCLVKHTWRN